MDPLPTPLSAPRRDALESADFRLRYDLAMDAGHMGAWEWDIRTGRVSWSPTLERMHGLELGTFGGTFEAFKRDIHPDDEERVLKAIQEHVDRRVDHHIEYRIVRRSGEERWVEAHGKLVVDDTGEPLRLLGVCMDVTERKVAELEREQLTKELQESGTFRERLIGIVAHDLRTPLSVMTLGVQSVLGDERLSPQGMSSLARVARACDRMTRLIAGLLNSEHARFGKGLPVTFGTIDLAEIVRRVTNDHEAVHPDCTIQVDSPKSASGRADGDRIAQVVSNLIENAIKHGEGPIRVTVSRDGDELLLRVANGGKAIDDETLSTLFQPFRRGATTADGLGLGLYIAREIMSAHGGRLDVTSSDEHGTAFTARWPVGPASYPCD